MKTALTSILAGFLLVTPLAAQSVEDFPTKPMTYIIPFNAGGESTSRRASSNPNGKT